MAGVVVPILCIAGSVADGNDVSRLYGRNGFDSFEMLFFPDRFVVRFRQRPRRAKSLLERRIAKAVSAAQKSVYKTAAVGVALV